MVYSTWEIDKENLTSVGRYNCIVCATELP